MIMNERGIPMRRLTRPTILLALATLPLFLLAGCGRPSAKIRYVTGGPDETVSYDSGTFQRARSHKVQVVLFRRTAAPIGEADPDFEYVFFELPDRPHYGWLKEDRIPAYRWVRQGGHDRIWLATAGQVRLTLLDRSLRLDFRTTMEPVAGTPGGAYVLTAVVRCPEDLIRTQGLINRYGQWLQSLLAAPPPAPPPASPPAAE